MTIQEKKRCLEEFRVNELEITHLQEELDKLESRMRLLEATWWAEAEESASRYRRELKQRLSRGLRQRREVARAIAALQDARLRSLMELRYIDGLTIETTAEKMAYSTRQVDNLIVCALRELDLPEIS